MLRGYYVRLTCLLLMKDLWSALGRAQGDLLPEALWKAIKTVFHCLPVSADTPATAGGNHSPIVQRLCPLTSEGVVIIILEYGMPSKIWRIFNI